MSLCPKSPLSQYFSLVPRCIPIARFGCIFATNPQSKPTGRSGCISARHLQPIPTSHFDCTSANCQRHRPIGHSDCISVTNPRGRPIRRLSYTCPLCRFLSASGVVVFREAQVMSQKVTSFIGFLCSLSHDIPISRHGAKPLFAAMTTGRLTIGASAARRAKRSVSVAIRC